MHGYAGQILHVDLSRGAFRRIPTARYLHWVGGHAMGTALFWDLVPDKTISAFHPSNLVTLMTSPLTGTLVPGAAARCEVQGIGAQSAPREWFTRSNLGGRFGAMLKYAGWDGLAVQGAARRPCWLDIRNGQVALRTAEGLWGLDAWETQRRIWDEVGGQGKAWLELAAGAGGGRSRQQPAVLCIGETGERLARVAALIHDAGNAAGQGGFGAVWGSKKLKAVSVIGTGSVSVADPAALLETQAWAQREYAQDIREGASPPPRGMEVPIGFGGSPKPGVLWRPRDGGSRPTACVACHAGCRKHHESGVGNDSTCMESAFWSPFDLQRHSSALVNALVRRVARKNEPLAAGLHLLLGRQQASYRAADLCQRHGINAAVLFRGLPWLQALHEQGLLGPGRAIATELDFGRLGEEEFAERLLGAIARREGLGDDLAEGLYRAAQRWGRLEEDLESGLLPLAHWGVPEHGYDPRAELEWGYGSLLGTRDINEHDFNALFWHPSLASWAGREPQPPAEEAVRIVCEKLIPFQGEPEMLDFGPDNMYGKPMARLVAWHRRYSRSWKQSMGFCDWSFPDFLNPSRADWSGMTPHGEPRFFKAVTGRELSFAAAMEIGRRGWTLDNAIWTLQGRHRDQARFAPYIYREPYASFGPISMYVMPGRREGRWEYLNLCGRHLDEEGVETWKSRYYALEGWDPATGWPTRQALESCELPAVADALEAQGRLGA